MSDLEYCCECDEPTGNAGKGDGSLYIAHEGPFCDDCHSNISEERFEEYHIIKSKLKAVEEAKKELVESIECIESRVRMADIKGNTPKFALNKISSIACKMLNKHREGE